MRPLRLHYQGSLSQCEPHLQNSSPPLNNLFRLLSHALRQLHRIIALCQGRYHCCATVLYKLEEIHLYA